MPDGSRFIVTGGLGCIGAWVATLLARDSQDVVIFDAGTDDHRLRLIASDEEMERITFVHGDLAERDVFANAVHQHEITNIVHLAALQVPYCREDPVLGAQVNVVGHVNVFEAARRHALTTAISYASSAAAHDPAGLSRPSTLYGVFKLADEGIADVYAGDHGVRSVGLRPACIYGPGRDRGITAAVTEAILAAGDGRPYRIPFGGRFHLHYAGDVAAAFIQASKSAEAGAQVRTMPSDGLVDLTDLVGVLDRIFPGAGAHIEVDDVTLPLSPDLPGEPFDVPVTPLEDGIRATCKIAVGA